MAEYKTEEEQVEDIKRWWEKNGKFVIIFGIIVIATTIGMKTWKDFEATKVNNASAQFELMMQEFANGKTDSVISRSSDIVKKTPDLAYAVLSSMMAAKVHVDKGEYDDAVTQLNWALLNATDKRVQHIIRIRLAKVLGAQGKFDEALTYATYAQQGAFSSQYAIAKGDIYYKKGELESARTAYQTAINDPRLNPQLKSFIQIKLDDMGVAKAEDVG